MIAPASFFHKFPAPFPLRFRAGHDAEMAVLNHGDFHWDNLLQNERGDIVLCDWQGVSAGAASGAPFPLRFRAGKNARTEMKL